MDTRTYLSRFSLGLFLVFVAACFTHPFEGNADFYHHLSSGKQIVNEHTFPYYDNLTHTANGKYWVAHSWGSGVLFYLIFSAFGEIGVILLCTLIAIITFVLLYLLLRSYKVSRFAGLISLLFGSAVISIRFPQRPELFTYPFVASFLLIDRLKHRSPRLVFWLPILTLLWANLYGSSTIFGLLLLFFLAVKTFIQDRFGFKVSGRNFYLAVALSGVASLLNPNGWNSLFYIFFIPHVAQYEGEWAGIGSIIREMPDSYILSSQYLILIYFIYLPIFLLMCLMSLRQLSKPRELGLMSLAVWLPFLAFRQSALAAILSLPMLAVLLEQKNQIIKSLVLILAVVMTAISIWVRPPLMSIPRVNTSREQLISFLKNNNLSGKAFNHESVGSLISFYLNPQVLVFFDTRDDLFQNTQVFNDLYAAQMNSQSVLPLLEKYRIDLVIADIYSDSLNYRDLYNSGQWAIVYFNDRYLVAVPRSTAISKNLEPIDQIDPFSASAAKPNREKEAETYYRSILATVPDSFSNQSLLVQTLLAQDKNTEAITVLRSMNIPLDPTGILFKKQRDYFLVKAYQAAGDCQSTQFYLNELDGDLSHKFIFDPAKKMEMVEEDLKAIYYLRCERDRERGDHFMKQFLNRRDINPKDKIRFQEKYAL